MSPLRTSASRKLEIQLKLEMHVSNTRNPSENFLT